MARRGARGGGALVRRPHGRGGPLRRGGEASQTAPRARATPRASASAGRAAGAGGARRRRGRSPRVASAASAGRARSGAAPRRARGLARRRRGRRPGGGALMSTGAGRAGSGGLGLPGERRGGDGVGGGSRVGRGRAAGAQHRRPRVPAREEARPRRRVPRREHGDSRRGRGRMSSGGGDEGRWGRAGWEEREGRRERRGTDPSRPARQSEILTLFTSADTSTRRARAPGNSDAPSVRTIKPCSSLSWFARSRHSPSARALWTGASADSREHRRGLRSMEDAGAVPLRLVRAPPRGVAFAVVSVGRGAGAERVQTQAAAVPERADGRTRRTRTRSWCATWTS